LFLPTNIDQVIVSYYNLQTIKRGCEIRPPGQEPTAIINDVLHDF